MSKTTTKSKKGMTVNVQPLRTADEIKEFREAIETSSNKPQLKRNLLLFSFGINTGLRISDIITLRIEDVKGRSYIIVNEGKTNKSRTVYLDAVMADIADYINELGQDTGWLFPSRVGDKHITTTQAYRILTRAGNEINRDDIGTHSLRKTYGYHYYKKFNDIAELMEIFNHSSQSITLRYIGIRQDELAKKARSMRL